jgi:hypothetical protein
LCLNTIDARDLVLRGTESMSFSGAAGIQIDIIQGSYTNTTKAENGIFDHAASGSATTTPMITPSSSTAAFTKCPSNIAVVACSLGVPPASISWNWPIVRFTNVTVATIVYRVDTETNSTSTRTDYHTDTVAEQEKGPTRTVNNADMWNSLLTTTGISMSDNVPVLDFTATVYTDVNAYITITTKLPFPTNYYNAGWLYEIGDMRPGSTNSVLGTSAASLCTWASQTLALMPSATLSGYDNPYYSPVKLFDWSSMVMTTMTKECTMSSQVWGDWSTTIQLVNALTETTTLYDDIVHSSTAKLGPTGSKAPTTSSIITGVDMSSTSDKFKSATPALTPVVIASHTLTPGAAPVTISGTKYSLAASGSTLVVDGSSSLVLASTMSGKSGIGNLIWSGLGGRVTGSAVSATYTGKGVRLQGTRITTAWWLCVSAPLALLAAY